MDSPINSNDDDDLNEIQHAVAKDTYKKKFIIILIAFLIALAIIIVGVTLIILNATKKEEESVDARITKAAARERLKVDDTTLWRWDKCGYLKAIHIGRSVYYREADIKRLEEGRL